MIPAKKMTHTGIIKEENGAIFLDAGSYSLAINMNGFNPEADRKALMRFVGKRVQVIGIMPPGRDELAINGVSEITPVKSRKTSDRPKAP